MSTEKSDAAREADPMREMIEPTTKRTVVIYHGHCLDGFCAAWMAWRRYGDDAEYVPAHYGQQAPDVNHGNWALSQSSFPLTNRSLSPPRSG